ncbi:hypothetical protein [Sulfuriferula nivalis]|uniref:DUF3828 domain-containing protein n=1 Tax=Sulfuriferula nivalis TaxID=2675298 RepID=A0A809S9Z4_9PROT|nr:hypothetical protein [Sulfuriferula nivalis]BBP01633.1 hypothetical protein SFSGTM_23410 [Sulfuriferula nivalis]
MSWDKNSLRLILFLTMFIGFQAFADDQQAVKEVIQRLYRTDVGELLCRDREDSQDRKLIVVSERYLSTDFMNYYGEVCKNTPAYTHWDGIIFDPRTGQNDSQMAPNNGPPQADFTNLKIEQPKIAGNKATIRTTYDLPVATYKEYGNFTVFTVIKENGQWKIDDIELGGHDMDKYNERESMTALKTYKSVKQYIKKSLMEAAARQHKSPK